jgi:oxepin-CoA hydrolase / 3-oxo-5,6-dehydrosuberyl-CoA semialdehyde dehydrogenase
LKAVEHGYFILSRAAGTSRAKRRDVDPPKGPVLLNYGLDECRPACRTGRFVKPVYPGSTIQVKFTCREKLDQEKRPKTADSPKGADVARGIVKWLVDVVDETGETVALATILTMVKKLDQNG